MVLATIATHSSISKCLHVLLHDNKMVQGGNHITHAMGVKLKE